MNIIEETIFTSEHFIIDADCKNDNVIVLLKGKGENIVQLNGKTILHLPSGHHMIRFTKNHFCLLYNSTLSFYSLEGDFLYETEVGSHISELFPYQDGVLCIYSDEGVFGNGLGRNILNYVEPFQKAKSFYTIATQYNLTYDALFARFKPYACIDPKRNELVFVDKNLKKIKSTTIPFEVGNVLTFALTYKNGIFIEKDKIRFWEFETAEQVFECNWNFSYYTRAIFHRHQFLFMEILNDKIRLLNLL